MSKEWIDFFAICGVLFVSLIVTCLVIIAVAFIRDAIHKRIIKHRFSKTPTAKCFCRDCKKWNPGDGECSDPCNSRHMNEAWFCCFADPINRIEEKQRDETTE